MTVSALDQMDRRGRADRNGCNRASKSDARPTGVVGRRGVVPHGRNFGFRGRGTEVGLRVMRHGRRRSIRRRSRRADGSVTNAWPSMRGLPIKVPSNAGQVGDTRFKPLRTGSSGKIL